MYVHFDFSHSLDTRSYLRMATGRFDSVRVTHRYRVLVPAAAAAVAAPLAKVYAAVWPQRPAGLWPLRFGFYLVNCLLVAAAAACWFNGARHVGATAEGAALAILALLTSRWAVYAAGLPLTDSLYLLVFSLAYYSVRRGPTGNWALVAALILGPLAKESFFLLLPWLLWFGRKSLSWPKQAVALSMGLIALAAVHYFVNKHSGSSASQSVTNALEHFDNIIYSLSRAASLKGIGELLSIFGFFTLAVPISLWPDNQQENSLSSYASLGIREVLLLIVVALHMLLSGDLGRMGYLAAPIFSAALALTFTHWRRFLRVQRNR
ncbi:hypothetical protein [Hymenobacter arizonensis]|uniref:Uncharacterized protein n=1 Tax=Hymenobacter arizonensis TaxID=1227077 RepID=A0A1I5ZIA0_HYMAR|nr:hypothetical protein [Hymenobacter arizonensis]SFQ56209.1 hypothetical protein SAMN04515668_2939 [Hymenobacter arizonensis]